MAEAIEQAILGISKVKDELLQAFVARDKGHTGALGGPDFKVQKRGHYSRLYSGSPKKNVISSGLITIRIWRKAPLQASASVLLQGRAFVQKSVLVDLLRRSQSLPRVASCTCKEAAKNATTPSVAVAQGTLHHWPVG